MKKIISIVSFFILLLVTAGISNAYFFVPGLKQHGQIVAYRGGGSRIDNHKLQQTGCTAKSLLGSEVDTIENTIEAVSAAVKAGADVIHLNVHRTRDDQLVVFHDWTLDCATNASGPVNRATYHDLEQVDAGFGYTFDDGATYPFRGKGFRISKLDEFFSRFPAHNFWLNLKDNDDHSFAILYRYLSGSAAIYARKTRVITSLKGVYWFQKTDPSIPVVSVDQVKDCGIDYLLLGWAGIVPESCKNTTLLIPPSKVKYFWGYPQRLAARLQQHGTSVYLWSEHQPIDAKIADVVTQGIGVVTSDTDFISKLHANNGVH
ncbi:MAG: glycerophosphodiester phosphodiesterase [Gammaproteobacteria bacterium]|nr:glycerophosphodiester phosphodiesterase [Gammaproteobacteria bacterium]MBU2280679.1 glycerophosphodiester phosphodiesterase [Gammaproteobacteria bacterium]